VSDANPDGKLLAEEGRLWTELHGLIDGLPSDQVEQVGYFAEGWSAKDLIGHIGSWLAEAGVVLDRIRFGTYQLDEIDILQLPADLLRDALHRFHRRHEDELRRETARRLPDDSRERRQAK